MYKEYFENTVRKLYRENEYTEEKMLEKISEFADTAYLGKYENEYEKIYNFKKISVLISNTTGKVSILYNREVL